jgi:thiamine-monophosphate kinase
VPKKPRRSGEFEIIARYFAPLARGAAPALGLTDDVALIAPTPGTDLVVKTDAVVESVHFLAGDRPELVARKALRVNISDLAAKGARPRWYLLDAILPRRIDDRWIAAFARGLAKDQAEFGIALIGGDMSSTPGPLTLAITALGEVPRGKMPRRSGARPGDDIYVSGTIGDGALGLLVATGKLKSADRRHAGFLLDRYRLPQPRVALGGYLLGFASAALDVSDGLVADLGHICESSRLGATVELARVPLSPAAAATLAQNPALFERILTGGDDYEILFTVPAEARSRVAALARRLELRLTRIGHMHAGRGVGLIDAAGRRRTMARGGWTHF